MTIEIENGISIRGLVQKISNKITPNIKLKLEEKISSILGNEILSMDFRCFDEVGR